MSGNFIISLDFEKSWGFNDLITDVDSFDQFSLVDDIVIRMLDIFSKYDVTATWAVVSAMLDISNELFLHRSKESLSPCENFIKIISECRVPDNTYSCSIDAILRGQHEIATHTHTHIYCNDDLYSDCEIIQDIEKSVNTINSITGDKCYSIIFPRNQVGEYVLSQLHDIGLNCYRGNNAAISDAVTMDTKWLVKITRYLDSYIPLMKTSFSEPVYDQFKLLNVPASRFLRISNLSILNYIHLQRVKLEMTEAAINSKNYHLWWHPHNFLVNQKSAFYILEELMKHFEYLKVKYNFKCLTMKDLMRTVNEA